MIFFGSYSICGTICIFPLFQSQSLQIFSLPFSAKLKNYQLFSILKLWHKKLFLFHERNFQQFNFLSQNLYVESMSFQMRWKGIVMTPYLLFHRIQKKNIQLATSIACKIAHHQYLFWCKKKKVSQKCHFLINFLQKWREIQTHFHQITKEICNLPSSSHF